MQPCTPRRSPEAASAAHSRATDAIASAAQQPRRGVGAPEAREDDDEPLVYRPDPLHPGWWQEVDGLTERDGFTEREVMILHGGRTDMEVLARPSMRPGHEPCTARAPSPAAETVDETSRETVHLRPAHNHTDNPLAATCITPGCENLGLPYCERCKELQTFAPRTPRSHGHEATRVTRVTRSLKDWKDRTKKLNLENRGLAERDWWQRARWGDAGARWSDADGAGASAPTGARWSDADGGWQ